MTPGAAAETDALRAALAFYANKNAYIEVYANQVDENGEEVPLGDFLFAQTEIAVMVDGGECARAALAAHPAAEDRFAAGRAAGLREAVAAIRTIKTTDRDYAAAFSVAVRQVEALGAADGADAGRGRSRGR